MFRPLLLICACVACACGLLDETSPATPTVPPPPTEAPPSSADALLDAADAQFRLLSDIYQRASPSVVNIESIWRDDWGEVAETRRGSGFIYDRQGHIITNAHLVKEAAAVKATLRNAYVMEAALVGLDSFSDLAVLKVDAPPERLAPLRIGESASVMVGSRAIAIGNPFGLSSSMTTGIVSGLGRSLPSAQLIDSGVIPGFGNPAIIQVDAAIHPGSSGGPLLNSRGLVIGIATAMRSDSGQFQGVGFAVPADTMRRVIPDLIANGHVEYAWMGISVMREDGGYGVAGLSEELGLPLERGALLRGVTEGSPAHRAGLRGGDKRVDVRGETVCAGGDLLVAINGYHFENLDALVTYLAQKTRPGDEVALLAIRDSETIEFRLTLEKRPLQADRVTIDCEGAP